MSSVRIRVPKGYHCPLCPNHEDDEFFQSRVVGAPICKGCAIELSVFLESEERPHDPFMDTLEHYTKRSFESLRRLFLEEAAEELERRLQPDVFRSEAALEVEWTGRTEEQVAAGWRQLAAQYREQLRRIKPADDGEEK